MSVRYQVTLPKDFLAKSRVRGGITIFHDGGYVGPLTDEQLEEINADSYLTVSELVDEEGLAAAKAAEEAEAKAKAEAEAKEAAEAKAKEEAAAKAADSKKA